MGEEAELEVKSNVFLGALNAALVILTYFFVIAAAHFYLKWYHSIDIVGIFRESLNPEVIPFLGHIFEFMSFLVEDVVVSTTVFAMMYMAYVANYKVEVFREEVKYRKGFLLLRTDEFDLGDVEQVYTEDYTFLPKTKMLCVKALDEDLIRIPYVRDAEAKKKNIIGLVKRRHAELETEGELNQPIKPGSEEGL